MKSLVLETPPATPAEVEAHYIKRLQFETDCWDVHDAFQQKQVDFVLLDARSSTAYAGGHIPGAISLPHRQIDESALALWPAETVFVVYCAGPHCNAADKAALKLAQLGRPCKVMIGGITGWLDEQFELDAS